MTRARRSRTLFAAAVRAHFRETPCPPSLNDLARRLHVSRQRVSAMADDAERHQLITRVKGQPFSIRLVEINANLSDDELTRSLEEMIHEYRRRGLPDLEMA